MHDMNLRSPVITLSNRTLVKIPATSKLRLRAGSLSCIAGVSAAPKESQLPPDFAILNKSAARALNLLPGTSYLVYSADQAELLIGPVVGIMTTAIRNRRVPMGKTGKLFKEMIDYAKKKGIFVYLFSPDGLSKDHYYIRGVTTTSNNSWKAGRFAWPDIIYNRIRFRKIEKQHDISRLLYELSQDQRVYVFNSRFLNKSEVYGALRSYTQAQNLVPATEPFSRSNLEDMLKKHREVFIKPDSGSIGQGIIKIKSLSGGRYSFAGASSSIPIWKGPYTFNLLYRHLYSEINRRNYLIQQAVDLARYKSRLFDVRSQVQKNYQGEWILTGAAVRVAGKDRFVTHIPNGGRAEVFKEVMLQVFPSARTRESIDKQLSHISAIVPAILEHELGINLAILTMDLGVDSSGHIWILEVNSKPSSFDEDDIRIKHLEHLTDYFIYAALKKNGKGKYEA